MTLRAQYAQDSTAAGFAVCDAQYTSRTGMGVPAAVSDDNDDGDEHHPWHRPSALPRSSPSLPPSLPPSSVGYRALLA
eukprot:2677118-Rhodomonas_salina.1